MAVRQRNLDALHSVPIFSPAVVDAAADTTAVDCSDFDGDVLLILEAAGSGAGNTMEVKVQHGNEANGSDAADVAAFSTLGENASHQALRVQKDDLGKYLRLSFHTEGGTYSAAVSCAAVGLKRRR